MNRQIDFIELRRCTETNFYKLRGFRTLLKNSEWDSRINKFRELQYCSNRLHFDEEGGVESVAEKNVYFVIT